MPLIAVMGLIWLLKNRYNGKRYLVLLCLLVTLGIGTAYSSVNSTYAFEAQQKPVPTTTSVEEIIGILDANGVNRIITDFWYGPPIRFLSSGNIQYAPQVGCNNPLPFDSRKDWFEPIRGIKSALIVDRGGLNYGYWGCTDQQLQRIYGTPSKEIVVGGVRPNDRVYIWIYNYDVRARLLPFPATN